MALHRKSAVWHRTELIGLVLRSGREAIGYGIVWGTMGPEKHQRPRIPHLLLLLDVAIALSRCTVGGKPVVHSGFRFKD